MPNSRSMFSDNPHYPAHQYKYNPKTDLPAHVQQEYRGVQSDPVPANMAELVTGKHRFKYFVRPIVPFLNAVPPEV